MAKGEHRMTIQDLFNQTCTVQKVTRADDGSGGQTESWASDIADMPCRIQALNGRELEAYMKMEVNADFKLFCLPQSSEITEGQHRISFESRLFDIVFVDKWNFAGHHWKLLLLERK